MGMNEQNWTRKEYETWDEAFRGQTAAVRQQSVRVAAYTQALFVQACSLKFGTATPDGQERMRGEYADLAYKCGMYHQLGKALVPPEYQLWRSDFTEEEIAVYRKYTTDGRLLVADLQDRATRAKERRKGTFEEQPTQNIPWLMIRETCQQHMERWNGSGYPDGLKGEQISPIAQIVGIAKELDRLASETKSETPFDDAIEVLMAQSGQLWSMDLIAVLKAAKVKCRAVYNKYIYYTMTLPKTVPLVERRKDRPMGLSYRPLVSDKEGTVAAYEAESWFSVIADRPGETETVEDLSEMLKRTGLVADVSVYFLYEAADTVVRMENCKLNRKGIVLKMMPAFYSLGSQLQRINQMFKEQGIEKDKLMLTIPEQVVKNASKATMETITRYLRNDIVLVLDDYHPETFTAAQLQQIGFTHVRFAPELNVQLNTANAMVELRRKGFTLIGGGADTPEALSWLIDGGVAFAGGTMTGVPVSDDELIRDALALEK